MDGTGVHLTRPCRDTVNEAGDDRRRQQKKRVPFKVTHSSGASSFRVVTVGKLAPQWMQGENWGNGC